MKSETFLVIMQLPFSTSFPIWYSAACTAADLVPVPGLHFAHFKRVSELQETLSASTIALENSSRNARVQAMQDRWSMLRAGILSLMIERAADMAEAPGGGTGLLVRQYQGGALAMPVYRVDTGLVSLIGQLLAHEKQEARSWATVD
jgi:hypothetical protein